MENKTNDSKEITKKGILSTLFLYTILGIIAAIALLPEDWKYAFLIPTGLWLVADAAQLLVLFFATELANESKNNTFYVLLGNIFWVIRLLKDFAIAIVSLASVITIFGANSLFGTFFNDMSIQVRIPVIGLIAILSTYAIIRVSGYLFSKLVVKYNSIFRKEQNSLEIDYGLIIPAKIEKLKLIITLIGLYNANFLHTDFDTTEPTATAVFWIFIIALAIYFEEQIIKNGVENTDSNKQNKEAA